jgi:hypothetical protein
VPRAWRGRIEQPAERLLYYCAISRQGGGLAVLMGGDVVYGGCVVLVSIDRGGIDGWRCCVNGGCVAPVFSSWSGWGLMDGGYVALVFLSIVEVLVLMALDSITFKG